MVCGPSSSGKSKKVCEIIRWKDYMIEEGWKIQNVIFAYQVWQPEYQKLQDEGIITTFKCGFPTLEEYQELVEPHRDNGSIFIFDDCEVDLYEPDKARVLEAIVKIQSRHLNCVTFVILQNVFPGSKVARQISLNVKYIHLMKNPRDKIQFQHLARQLCGPGSYKYLVQAYLDSTAQGYSSFLIDLTQSCIPAFRYRSSYMPHELPMKIYFPKNAKI